MKDNSKLQPVSDNLQVERRAIQGGINYVMLNFFPTSSSQQTLFLPGNTTQIEIIPSSGLLSSAALYFFNGGSQWVLLWKYINTTPFPPQSPWTWNPPFSGSTPFQLIYTKNPGSWNNFTQALCRYYT